MNITANPTTASNNVRLPYSAARHEIACSIMGRIQKMGKRLACPEVGEMTDESVNAPSMVNETVQRPPVWSRYSVNIACDVADPPEEEKITAPAHPAVEC